MGDRSGPVCLYNTERLDRGGLTIPGMISDSGGRGLLSAGTRHAAGRQTGRPGATIGGGGGRRRHGEVEGGGGAVSVGRSGQSGEVR